MTTNQLLWLDQDGLRVGGTQLWTSGGGVGIGTSSIYGGLTVGTSGAIGLTSNVALAVFGSGVYNGTQTFTGTSSAIAEILTNAAETTTVLATAAGGSVLYNVSSQSVLYYTANAVSNWTLNITFSPTASLNSVLAIGQSMTLVFMATQGSSPYYTTGLQIDGVSVTAKWQGGSAPTSGNANGIDIYSYTIIKTAAATYTALASQSQFA